MLVGGGFRVVGLYYPSSTDELDRIGHEFLLDHNAYPSTLGYRGFPKSLCASPNSAFDSIPGLTRIGPIDLARQLDR